ncbi:F-box/LRR-repeat protein 8-like [Acipenser oxyrinchus oxyrinchus]|uniref:F-box/LRR-repeat protein 8 n=1 Tax=Acipenser oxyrinchus oxyrinchus TaxID=40147 RepID=A0AAD8D4S6_ACIOX|nr:F-box/LRR-repeat protein 8-like [Acipenser oxyrinchus oxyrinchus]
MEIPVEILAQIFSYLPLCDRYSASSVCKAWAEAISFPTIWYYTEVSCESGTEEHALQTFCHFLTKVKHLKIVLNQSEAINRGIAIKVIKHATDANSRLRNLCVSCTGENPLFYSGQDILQTFRNICQNEASGLSLKEVDFRHMPFTLDDSLIMLIATRSPHLQKLYINNQTLVCNITAETVKQVLTVCPELSTLGVFYASLSENVLSELLKPERPPFRLLELFCERLDKYIPAISRQFWVTLCKRHPSLSVNMILDHTLPAKKITWILQPGIPMKSLDLITYTYLVKEVNFVAKNYHASLERLVLQTTSSEKLNSALIELASCCVSLKEIHCYCVVSQEVVQAFISCCPGLRRYTLKTVKELHPWRCTVIK